MVIHDMPKITFNCFISILQKGVCSGSLPSRLLSWVVPFQTKCTLCANWFITKCVILALPQEHLPSIYHRSVTVCYIQSGSGFSSLSFLLLPFPFFPPLFINGSIHPLLLIHCLLAPIFPSLSVLRFLSSGRIIVF